jgi:hypothetical protein
VFFLPPHPSPTDSATTTTKQTTQKKKKKEYLLSRELDEAASCVRTQTTDRHGRRKQKTE